MAIYTTPWRLLVAKQRSKTAGTRMQTAVSRPGVRIHESTHRGLIPSLHYGRTTPNNRIAVLCSSGDDPEMLRGDHLHDEKAESADRIIRWHSLSLPDGRYQQLYNFKQGWRVTGIGNRYPRPFSAGEAYCSHHPMVWNVMSSYSILRKELPGRTYMLHCFLPSCSTS